MRPILFAFIFFIFSPSKSNTKSSPSKFSRAFSNCNGSNIFGTVVLKDCSLASFEIFTSLSVFKSFFSLLSEITGWKAITPISVHFWTISSKLSFLIID
jgi:hypothetical protein